MSRQLAKYETYAKLCSLVYGRTFNQKLLGYSSQTMIRNKHDAAFIRILDSEDEVVVVFRGTKFLNDWLVNLQAWPKKHNFGFSECWVHSGFISALLHEKKSTGKTILEEVWDAITPLVVGQKKLVFTGHSLGGALAMLAAASFSDRLKHSVISVFTFGQPAVGFKKFDKLYPLQRKTIRINACIDIVTFLPGPFYRHVGKQLWVHDGKIFRDVHWARRIAKTILLAITSIVGDHSMQKYIRHRTTFDLARNTKK